MTAVATTAPAGATSTDTCERCGHAMDDHDFGVPAPICPGPALPKAAAAAPAAAVPAITDSEIADALEAAGVQFICFPNPSKRGETVWMTSGSQDVSKLAAGVRSLLAAERERCAQVAQSWGEAHVAKEIRSNEPQCGVHPAWPAAARAGV